MRKRAGPTKQRANISNRKVVVVVLKTFSSIYITKAPKRGPKIRLVTSHPCYSTKGHFQRRKNVLNWNKQVFTKHKSVKLVTCIAY